MIYIMNLPIWLVIWLNLRNIKTSIDIDNCINTNTKNKYTQLIHSSGQVGTSCIFLSVLTRIFVPMPVKIFSI